jgi:hypothetical protein
VYWSLLVLFVCLILLTQWITKHIQGVGYLVTGDGQVALVLYFLLILPGVLIHEISHALIAWLLRVPVRHFSIGVRQKGRGRQVALGSVDIASTDPLRASLIGIAPLLFGCGAIWAISGRVLGVGPLTTLTAQSFWLELQSIYRVPDFALWLYLVFAISNAMLPSAADRRSWGIALVFLLFLGALGYFSGLFDTLAEPLGSWARGGAHHLTYAFAVTVAVDLFFAAILFFTEHGLTLLGFGRLEYR